VWFDLAAPLTTVGASTAVSVTTVAAVSITTTVAAAVVVPNMGIT